MFLGVKAMVLGDGLGPKPGPQEASRGPKTTKHKKAQNHGNQIIRVSMGRPVGHMGPASRVVINKHH
jgi:hypothetical protein